MDIGAADVEMDLTPFKVEKIDIDGGACAIELKLGDKYKKTYVKIEALLQHGFFINQLRHKNHIGKYFTSCQPICSEIWIINTGNYPSFAIGRTYQRCRPGSKIHVPV